MIKLSDISVKDIMPLFLQNWKTHNRLSKVGKEGEIVPQLPEIFLQCEHVEQ